MTTELEKEAMIDKVAENPTEEMLRALFSNQDLGFSEEFAGDFESFKAYCLARRQGEIRISSGDGCNRFSAADFEGEHAVDPVNPKDSTSFTGSGGSSVIIDSGRRINI